MRMRRNALTNWVRRTAVFGCATLLAWTTTATLQATIGTIGGVNVQPSAWAQPKEGDKDAGGGMGGDEKPLPPPNPAAGYLGAKFQGITDEMADEMKLDSQLGVIVTELLPNSPAAADAGLKVKDIIRQMDGKPVEDVRAFVMVMRETKPGQAMKFGVLRAGQQMDVEITLGKRPAGMNGQGKIEKPPTTNPSEK